MDKEIKDYADSLYERLVADSSRILTGARAELARSRVVSSAGYSGAAVAAIIRIYVDHIERCMTARLSSYQQSYEVAGQVPTDQDLSNILIEFEAIQQLQVRHSAAALKNLGGLQNGPQGDSTDRLLAGSAHGHDRVLADWKVWRAEAQLRKPSPRHTPAVEASDEFFQRMAIEEAKKSVAEDGRPRPKVGVVVVRDGVVLAKAHRGEISKCHAEFIALEEKLTDMVLTGATVYTTLEPCTSRNHPKVPCATRLAERKVARVVIGMLDPNKDISGRGQRQLRKSSITTELFKPDLMGEIEELNREFIRAHETDHDNVRSLREQKSTNVLARDWTTEWTEQEARFRKLERSPVFAEFWMDESGEALCSIRSDGEPEDLAECKAACGFAGGRLLASPGLELSSPVRSERENWKRWLIFLKETHGLNREFEDGTGYIKNLAAVSARVCVDCAARTFGGP